MRILQRVLLSALAPLTLIFLALTVGSGANQNLATSGQNQGSISALAIVAPAQTVVGNTVSVAGGQDAVTLGETKSYQWYSCDEAVAAGSKLDTSCREIAGATAKTLELTNNELGKHLVVSAASLTNTSAPRLFSAATPAAVGPAPLLSATPTGLNKTVKFVSATATTSNSKITVTRGAWPDSAAGYAVTYAWFRCADPVQASDSLPAGCEEISGASASSYTVTLADVGDYISAKVTATLAGVTSEVWTTSLGKVTQPAKFISGGSVTGSAPTYGVVTGAVATANEGTWEGEPTFTYQWYSCTKAVAASAALNTGCTLITGARAKNYNIPATMNNKFLMFKMVATNPVISPTLLTRYSASSVKVLIAPSSSVAVKVSAVSPDASGNPIVGNGIRIVAGTWLGNPAPTKTYQWYSCTLLKATTSTSKPQDCDAIAGATAASYPISQDDFGSFLVVEERAKSTAGEVSIWSASSKAVVSRPIYAADPSISGTLEIGSTLTAIPGVDADSMHTSISYQWYYCTSESVAVAIAPAGCTNIVGSTASTFTLIRSLEGRYISVRVTLTNAAGSTVRFSATTDYFETAPLFSDSALKPILAAGQTQAVVNSPITAPGSSWQGAPAPQLEYSWLECETEGARTLAEPSDCFAIDGANLATYTPSEAEAGSYLRVQITGSNLLGENTVWSATTNQVYQKPTFTSTPSLSGTYLADSNHSVRNFDSVGFPDVATTFAWYLCPKAVPAAVDAVPTGCTLVSSATTDTYMVNYAALDKYVGALVTLKNAAGTTTKFTAVNSAIQGQPKFVGNFTAPSFVGADSKVGLTFTAANSNWVGSPAVTKSLQWFSCVNSTSTLAADCNEIAGATAATYVATSNESGRYLRVRAQGANALGTVTVWSPATSEILETATFKTDPTISGTAMAKTRLTVDASGARGNPEISVTFAWYKCTSAVAAVAVVPGTCTQIVGATSNSYLLTNAELDKYVAALVTVSNRLGSTQKLSASTAVVKGGPTMVSSITAPTFVGTNPKLGLDVTAPNTIWVGSPAVTKTMQWFTCAIEDKVFADAQPEDCVAISGATATTYKPGVDDVDRFLRLAVTGSNGLASVTYFSPTTSQVQELPNFIGEPTINRLNLVGEAVTVGDWITRGSPTPIPSIRWYRCAAAVPSNVNILPAGCVAIAGALDDTYVFTTADLDKFVVAYVTLNSDIGSSSRSSLSSPAVQGAPQLVGTLGSPVSTSPKAGLELTAVDSQWAGSPTPTKSYQWFSCIGQFATAQSTLPAGCSEIAGAAAAKMTPSLAHVGGYLSLRITASNKFGNAVRFTPTTSQVYEIPTFTSEPTLNNLNLVGDRLLLNEPTFKGTPAPDATFAWMRCPTPNPDPTSIAPTGCTLIAAETANNYLMATEDLDQYLVAKVTITSAAGTTVRYSASSIKILGLPKLMAALSFPTSATTAPKIGQAVNIPPSTWSGSPKPSTVFQWLRCDDSSKSGSDTPIPGCVEIAGATAATYTPALIDVQKALRVRITATNDLGAVTKWSPTTQLVQEPPSFLADPAVNSFYVVGKQIRVNALSVKGFPSPTESYQWYRCLTQVTAVTSLATAPTGCTAIAGETLVYHTIQEADLDKFLLSQVTITNTAGATAKFTASSVAIISAPTFVTGQESRVKGQSYVGGTLVLDGGVISAKPAATRTIQWYVCTNQTFFLAQAAPTDCFPISGATLSEYKPTLDDVGKYIAVMVTGTNIAGTASSLSISTEAILRPPQNLIPPVVSGTSIKGYQLRSDTGTWKASGFVTYDTAWFSCTTEQLTASDKLPTGCTAIAGATTQNLTLTATHVGKFMLVRVTAKNNTIPVEKYSASSEVIGEEPLYTSGMAVTLPTGQASTTGAPRVGYTIEAVPGIWSGTPAPTFTYQWFSCNKAIATATVLQDSACNDIYDAKSKVLTITSDLVDAYLGVKITGKNKAGNDFRFSATATKAVQLPPTLVTDPVIVGYNYVDGSVTTTKGVWSGKPATNETVAWWQCDSAVTATVLVKPTGCSQILNATALTLKLTLAMKGKFVTPAITSTNEAGVVTAWIKMTKAVTTGAIATIAPSITVAPVGEPKTGGTVTANKGVWSGDPALTESNFAYQWYRCPAKIAAAAYSLSDECIALGDAIGSSYTMTSRDAGNYMVVEVTGTNSQGGSTIYSASSNLVNLKPENTTLPLLSGRAFVDENESVDTGIWNAVPKLVATDYKYQWFICNSEQTLALADLPGDCTTIAGATAATYKPIMDQVGQFLIARVTATNIAGSTVAYSLTSPEVQSGPVNRSAPLLTLENDTAGKPVAKQTTISTLGGVWAGRPTPTLTFEWFSCEVKLTALAEQTAENLAKCRSVVPEGTQKSYDPTIEDRGRYIAVKVHGHNVSGDAYFWSATSDVVNMIPENVTLPSVEGVAFVQGTVNAALDTWNAFPDPKRSFQWFVCGEIEIPTACSAIPGATNETYAIPSTMAGKSLIAKVTAYNAFGSGFAYSQPTARITTGPVNTADPVVSGTAAYPAVGSLSATDGTWAGDPRPDLSYQWYRCSELVAASAQKLDPKCLAIEGATSNSYTITEDDPGNALLIGVTGTNVHGTSTRFTKSTAKVTEVVRMVTAPVIVGAPKIGQKVTGNDGVWRGYEVPSTVKTWYSCTAPVAAPTSGVGIKPPTGCTPLTTLTVSSEYQVPVAQLDKFLVYGVVKSNKVGTLVTTITAFSASSARVAQPPELNGNARPKLSSPNVLTNANPLVGSTWKLDNETTLWKTANLDLRYQWYRCTSAVANGATQITAQPDGCTAIDGANKTSYTIVAEDSGSYLSIEVVGKNSADEVHVWSDTTASVFEVPLARVMPVVSGVRLRGETLTSTQGEWTGNPQSFSYQWYACSSEVTLSTTVKPAQCNLIGGANTSSYTQGVAGSDDGKWITVAVTGSSGPNATTTYWIPVAKSEVTAKVPSPALSSAPQIRSLSGKFAVGEIFVFEGDTWDSFPEASKSYAWYSCAKPGIPKSDKKDDSCVKIDNEELGFYTATEALSISGRYLMGSVTATNPAGQFTVYSASLPSAIRGEIKNTSTVSVSASSLVVPTTITTTRGAWQDTDPLTTVVVNNYFIACKTKITKILSYQPDDCTDQFPDTDSISLEIGELSPYAGFYISAVEDVSLQVAGKADQFVRSRVSVSTDLIKQAPAIWTTHPVFTPPTVPAYMVVDYAGQATEGLWSAANNKIAKTTWRGSPTGTTEYQWFACRDPQAQYATSLPAGCGLLATSPTRSTLTSSLKPTEAEIGKFLGIKITAKNEVGSAEIYSATSNAVTQEVSNRNAPTIGTSFKVPDQLTITGGLASDWKGTSPTISVEWFACKQQHQGALTALPADCDVALTNSGDTPKEAIRLDRVMSGKYVLVRITGRNKPRGPTGAEVTAVVYSVTSAKIVEKPYNITAPKITGTADVGSALTLDQGIWGGTPWYLGAESINFTFRYFACDTPQSSPSDIETVAPGCTLVNRVGSTLALTHQYVQKYMVGQMVAKNDAGTVYLSTASTPMVKEPPTIVTPPELSGGNVVGQTLTTSVATWDAYPVDPSPFTKFYACTNPNTTPVSTLPVNCTVLTTNVNGSALTLAREHAGKYIIAESKYTNTVNAGLTVKSSFSASFGPIMEPPYFLSTAIPTIAGTAHVGSTLTFTPATAGGYDPPTSTYLWYICDTTVATPVDNAVPAGCSAIAGSAGKPLTVPASASGKFVLAIQTASALWTPLTATKSTATSVRITATPLNTSAASISGDDYVGGPNALTINKGTWTSYPALVDANYVVSWFACTGASAVNAPVGCAATAVATGNTFTPTAAQAGKHMVARVVATVATNKSATDATTFYTASLGPIRMAPTLPDQPTFSGSTTPDVGVTLNMTTTVPGGFPVNTPTYNWYICPGTAAGVPTSIPANCEVQTASANGPFTIPAAAAGQYILGWVTASNSVGSISKGTVYSLQVKQAPSVITAPAITGDTLFDQTLTASTGTWNGFPNPTYGYQYYSCDTATSAISSCALVATTATLKLGELQAGKYIAVKVTASVTTYAGVKTASSVSAYVGPVRMAATVKSVGAITGTVHVGETVSIGAISTVGAPTPNTTYAWYQCDTAITTVVTAMPSNCQAIDAPETAALQVPSSAAGKFIAALVHSKNVVGETWLSTLTTSQATMTLTSLTPPSVTGDVFVTGAKAQVSAGTWSSWPIVDPAKNIVYTWYQCDTASYNASCVALTADAGTPATITQNASMAGKYLIAKATATVTVAKQNSGTATAYSDALGPIESAPSFKAAPTIAGELHVGSSVEVTAVNEAGYPGPSKSYEWFVCSTAVTTSAPTLPNTCATVAAESNGLSSLTIPANAGGAYIAVVISLHNSRGDVSKSSLTSIQVTSTPVSSLAPSLSGSDFIATGKTITATTGTWITTPSNIAKTYSYTWYACNTDQAVAPAAKPDDCIALTVADSATLTLTDAMAGKHIMAKVTISVNTNKPGAGTASAFTATLGQIRKGAVITTTPVVSGAMHVGEIVTANDGAPTGVPTPTVTYKWYACTSAVATPLTAAPTTNCAVITDSTTNTLTIPASAAGKFVIALLTASSDTDLGAVSKSSISSLAVSSTPVNTVAPTLSGLALTGGSGLTATTGTFTWQPSTLKATYSYTWYSCTLEHVTPAATVTDDCTVIPLQNSANIILKAAQLGTYIQAVVTANIPANKDTAGSASFASRTSAIIQALPVNTSAPSISLLTGSKFKANLGTWAGSAPLITTYVWYVCDATTTIKAGDTVAPATCVAQTATGDYSYTAAQKGKKMLLRVSGSNNAGIVYVLSSLVTIP